MNVSPTVFLGWRRGQNEKGVAGEVDSGWLEVSSQIRGLFFLLWVFVTAAAKQLN